MAYCSRCGVEVEQSRTTCPLCDAPIHRYEELGKLSKLWPNQRVLPKKKILFLQAAMIIPACFLLIIAFLIILVLDLRPDGILNWSAYALTSVGSVCLGFGGILFVGRNRVLSIAWVTSVLLFMMKLFHSHGGGVWFTEIAVPITVLAALIVYGSLFSWVFFKKKFRLQVTIHALLLMVLCFGINTIVNEQISWSLIVAIPFGVIAATGVFSIGVLPKLIDFDKYFHS